MQVRRDGDRRAGAVATENDRGRGLHRRHSTRRPRGGGGDLGPTARAVALQSESYLRLVHTYGRLREAIEVPSLSPSPRKHLSPQFYTKIRTFSVLIRSAFRMPTICKNSPASRFHRVISSGVGVTFTLRKHQLECLGWGAMRTCVGVFSYLELNNLRRELTTFCTASTATGRILYGENSLGFAASPASIPRRQARRSSVLT